MDPVLKTAPSMIDKIDESRKLIKKYTRNLIGTAMNTFVNRFKRSTAAFFLFLTVQTFTQGGEEFYKFDPNNIGPKTLVVDLSEYWEVRHVSAKTGSDTHGDGSSARPSATIFHALSTITDAGPEKRYAVLVAEGKYKGETLTLQPYVDLCGGYFASDWSRDIFKNPTILDGGLKRRVVVGADHAKLDGFIVKRGRVRGKGAGILCENTSPGITNNFFIDNMTYAPADWDPPKWHEVASDGGAIMCNNNASPNISNNIFAGNRTEIGRGAGVTCDNHSSPTIAHNVFSNNVTGLIDFARSADGGAMSVYDWSHPKIVGNVISNNESLNGNDVGGIFVALWSSPLIAGNIIVGNIGGDDGGGIFVGGQKHHYGTPLDPQLPREDFLVRILNNIIMGNDNSSHNSGSMRITMESRVELKNNIIAENVGHLYLQRSSVLLENNTITGGLYHTQTKEGLVPGEYRNNIIHGLIEIDTAVELTYNNLTRGYEGIGNFIGDPQFVDNGEKGKAVVSAFDRRHFLTSLKYARSNTDSENENYSGRVIKVGEKWGVVASNDAEKINVWGDFSRSGYSDIADFEIMPTYHLKADSPCIDAGHNDIGFGAKKDMDLEDRPLNGGIALRVDVGADEYSP